MASMVEHLERVLGLVLPQENVRQAAQNLCVIRLRLKNEAIFGLGFVSASLPGQQPPAATVGFQISWRFVQAGFGGLQSSIQLLRPDVITNLLLPRHKCVLGLGSQIACKQNQYKDAGLHDEMRCTSHTSICINRQISNCCW